MIDPDHGAESLHVRRRGKVSEKPAEFVPSRTAGDLEAGVLWRGDNQKAVEATGEPYVQINLSYGDAIASPYRQPYDSFTAGIRLGGGSAISEGLIRGRLYGKPLGKDGSSTLLVFQAYDYVTNNAFEFGGQSVFTAVAKRFKTSGRHDVSTVAGGGPLLLGAFNSPYVVRRGALLRLRTGRGVLGDRGPPARRIPDRADRVRRRLPACRERDER